MTTKVAVKDTRNHKKTQVSSLPVGTFFQRIGLNDVFLVSNERTENTIRCINVLEGILFYLPREEPVTEIKDISITINK